MITDSQREMVSRILGGDMRGRLLRKGSRGVSVRALQLFLKQQGIDVGKADGKFGDRTLAGLKAWQKKSGLSTDGKAGTQTFGKIKTAVQEGNAIPRPRPEGVSEVDKMDAAAAPLSLPHPISKPVAPPAPVTRDFSMADEPPVWQGGNSPLAGGDMPPAPPPMAPEPPPVLEQANFGGSPDFGATFGPTPNFDDPAYGSGMLYPEISSPKPTGDPGQNAMSMQGLDELSRALKMRIDQQSAGAGAPANPAMPPQGMGQPQQPYPDLIRALMAGGR